jgi:DNA-binding protein H-NS
MNILKKADQIINERSEEKKRMYGPFDKSMQKAATIASELCNKTITTEDFYKCMIAL